MEKVTKRKVFAASASAALVASAVVPAATFAATADFTDISNLPEAEQAAINALVKDGIINGKGDGKFDPFAQMKRAEAATIVAKLLKLDVDNAPSADFDDVANDYWAKKYIDAAVSAGVLEGKGDGKFDPETPMKRAEFAQLVVKTFGLERVHGVNHNFNDVPDNYWGKEAIEILYSNGLINGKSETRFAPEERMQRNHVALLIQRAIDPNVFEFKIESVTALDDTNRFLQINFTQKVNSLEPSNITIEDAKSKERYGVKEVNLSSNGLIAQVELFSHEGREMILENNRDYTVTVKANNKTLQYTFNRPAFLEQRVVKADVVDRKIEVWNKDSGTISIKVPNDMKDFDFQTALGEKVSVWYNQDNELVDFSIPDKLAKYDAVELKEDEVKLIGANETHDISTEDRNVKTNTTDKKFALYINGKRISDGKSTIDKEYQGKYNYAKVGFDKSGDVEFVSAYTFDQFLIVDKVDGNEIIGVEGNGTGGEYAAKDATIIKNGKNISKDDLEKGDIIFYNTEASGKDKLVEVYNNSVSGEISDVYRESVRVDGKTYDFVIDDQKAKDYRIGYGGAVYIKDNGKTEVVDYKAAEEIQAAGNATLYFDRAGNLVYIGGDLADVESNNKVSILTANIEHDSNFGKDQVQVEVVNEDGKEKLHQLTLEDLKTISVNGVEYDVDKTPEGDKERTVSIDDAGENIELTAPGKTKISIPLEAEGKLVKVNYNNDEKVTGLEFFLDKSVNDGKEGFGSSTKTIEAGDSYIEGKRLLSSTVVFDATDGYKKTPVDIKADDVTVTTWGDYKGSDFNAADFIYNDKNEVIALVIKATTTTDQVYEEAVITNVLRNTDNEVVEVKAFVNGKEETLKVDKIKNDIAKGDVAVFEFSKNNKDLVKNIHTSGDVFNKRYAVIDSITSDDINIGNKEVKDGNTTYRLVSEGAVINVSDKDKIETKTFSHLRDKTNVIVVKDETEGNFVKYFIVGGKPLNINPEDDNDDNGNDDDQQKAAATLNADDITVEFGVGDQNSEVKLTFTNAINHGEIKELELGDEAATIAQSGTVAAKDNSTEIVIKFAEDVSEITTGEITFDVVVPEGEDNAQGTFTITVKYEGDKWTVVVEDKE